MLVVVADQVVQSEAIVRDHKVDGVEGLPSVVVVQIGGSRDSRREG